MSKIVVAIVMDLQLPGRQGALGPESSLSQAGPGHTTQQISKGSWSLGIPSG